MIHKSKPRKKILLKIIRGEQQFCYYLPKPLTQSHWRSENLKSWGNLYSNWSSRSGVSPSDTFRGGLRFGTLIRGKQHPAQKRIRMDALIKGKEIKGRGECFGACLRCSPNRKEYVKETGASHWDTHGRALRAYIFSAPFLKYRTVWLQLAVPTATSIRCALRALLGFEVIVPFTPFA